MFGCSSFPCPSQTVALTRTRIALRCVCKRRLLYLNISATMPSASAALPYPLAFFLSFFLSFFLPFFLSFFLSPVRVTSILKGHGEPFVLHMHSKYFTNAASAANHWLQFWAATHQFRSPKYVHENKASA